MELSIQEMQIIDMLREAKPFETILIVKDQLGRPNHYIATRTQKIIISEMEISAIKV